MDIIIDIIGLFKAYAFVQFIIQQINTTPYWISLVPASYIIFLSFSSTKLHLDWLFNGSNELNALQL